MYDDDNDYGNYNWDPDHNMWVDYTAEQFTGENPYFCLLYTSGLGVMPGVAYGYNRGESCDCLVHRAATRQSSVPTHLLFFQYWSLIVQATWIRSATTVHFVLPVKAFGYLSLIHI